MSATPFKPAIPMRAWCALRPRRGLPDGRNPRPEIFVVDRGPSAEKVVTGLVAELHEVPWRDPHDYVLIDSRGDIKEEFAVTTWSIEEELGASVFAVVDGALRKLSVSVFYSDPVRVKRIENAVVNGLQAVAGDDDKTLSFLSSALSRHDRMRADKTRHQNRAADARVAAIPGAGDDHGIGDDFALAQELLRCRFKAYSVEIDGAMLRSLARLGILHRSIRILEGSGKTALAVLAAALDAFVIACRLVAADRSLENKGVGPPLEENAGTFAALPAKIQTELRDLEKMLGGLERDLLQQAEWKEWSDARFAAIDMRAAAAHVTHAREHLQQGSRQEFQSTKNAFASEGLVTETKPADTPIPIGKRHRTLCDVKVLVYDYDSSNIETAVLHAGDIFQPWAPDDHWRGEKVPITLGDRHSEFDWGVSSFEGHFLKWDDYFSKCELAEGGGASMVKAGE